MIKTLRAGWGGGGGVGQCLRTIKVEDGNLFELVDLFVEIFAGKQMGNSNIILLGSANQMSRTGSSGYVFNWLACADKIVSRWPNVKVCPLVPLWSEPVSGKLVRTVQELCSVFQSLFGNDPRALGNSWTVLTRELAKTTFVPNVTDSEPVTYSLPFPASLSGPTKIKSRSFVSCQRCPAMAPQLSCKAKSLVVCSLAEELNASLSAGIDPGITVERAPDAGGAAGAKDLSLNFLVTGSSHMSRVIPHIRAKGFAVSDLTEKSWHLSKNSFEKLSGKLQTAELGPLSVTVHDLFGNTSIRFNQRDDTLSLPVKLDGVKGWHLAGDAVYTPDNILRDQVKMVCTLNKVLEGRAKIFIPPIPRNVFGPCCGAPTHAPNTRTAEHPKHALEEHTRMRHTIIKGLAAGGMSKHRVIDFMHGISGGSDSPSNRMAALKADTHPDMVHLSTRGYEKLAAIIISTAEQMVQQTRTQAVGIEYRVCRGLERIGWHGFISTTGYGRTSRVTPTYAGRGRGVRHHPYNKR